MDVQLTVSRLWVTMGRVCGTQSLQNITGLLLLLHYHRNCDSTTAVAREQLCGHVVSSAAREHAIMVQTFTMRSVRGLYIEDE
jgi:hypothetical protein